MSTATLTVTFTLPNLQGMTDQELQKHFFDRDGPWSESTKLALKKFKVDKLDLDQHWASTPRWWTCPGCNREKRHIFRLSPKGILLARLDLHHDHLQDRMKSLLRSELGNRWVETVGSVGGRVYDYTGRMISRFEPTLVCIDCNNVDGRLKAEFKDIPEYFSFSPKEIFQVIKPKPHHEHDIDLKAAYELYLKLAVNLEARTTLLARIVEMFIAGDLNQEHGRGTWTASDEMHRHLVRGLYDNGPAREVSDDLAAFRRRSESRASSAAAIAKKRPAVVTSPTDEEFENYDGGGEADGLWKAAPVDWRCPACGRTRREILRPSNNRQRKWSGKLLRHTEYIVTSQWEDDAVDREETHVICSDCANIAPEVKRRNADLSDDRLFFQLADMRAAAEASPHQAHKVNWPRATERLRNSEYLSYLVAMYRIDRQRAFSCLSDYKELFAQHGKNQAAAKAAMVRLYCEAFKIGPTEAESHIRELLQRASYLSKSNPGEHYSMVRNSHAIERSKKTAAARQDEANRKAAKSAPWKVTSQTSLTRCPLFL